MLQGSNVSPRQSKWFHVPKPVNRPRLRLFCFPYAGGSASIYHQWPSYLPDDIEMCALQLPGRGARIAEEPFVRIEPLMEALEEIIVPFMDTDFAFFGHSLGAIVAYELNCWLEDKGYKLPKRLFVAGRSAPQIVEEEEAIHALPSVEFWRKVEELEGTPEEVLNHPELKELVEPILRSDFELFETWRYKARESLKTPISAMGGLKEFGGKRNNIESWKEQTASEFKLHMFPGDHFFIHDNEQDICGVIGRTLYKS